MNLKNILSKTDFKVALDCPTKLYYRKHDYQSINDENSYLEYLAEGGYAVAKMASLYYPNGIRIDNYSGVEKAIEQTKSYMNQENCILFEAAFLSGKKLAVIDILVKEGNSVQLIEVKSKGHDNTKKISKIWEDDIIDVAFQKLVFCSAYPEIEASAFIMAPDKNKTTSIEGLNAQFKLKGYEQKNGFNFFDIDYSGDSSKIIKDNLLTLVPIDNEIHKEIESVQSNADLFEQSVSPEITKIETALSKNCFKCEYKDSGKKECWKNKTIVQPAIDDLFYIGVLGGPKGPIANHLIESNKLSLYDIPLEKIKGKRAIRQLVQIKHTKSNSEWISDDLRSEINSWEYPLHFIDFETAISALPFHKNMHPYEMSAFQWSCHTIPHPGAEPLHNEWINLEPQFPSFKFAETLMNCIGDTGTPLMWSSHENTTLRNIYHQAKRYNYSNPDLMSWLERLVKMGKSNKGRFIDMDKLCKEGYFHPSMKGRTSIKVTLPAVLKANRSKRTESWLQNFSSTINLLSKDEEDNIVDPYKNLPPLEFLEHAEYVNEGTGAMRAYEDMIFGKAQGIPAYEKAYKEALLNYCKLDTLAMVIIWEHWK